jgi:DNA-binding GntR family transcriptional regulator
VLPRVIEAMRGNIAAGIITIDALRTEKEVILEASYRCSRDTARKARNAVISEIVAK